MVSPPLSPLDNQDLPQVDLESTLYLDHPPTVPLVELEAPALLVDSETLVSALEAQADSLVSEFLDQVVDLWASAQAWEADLHIPALFLEQTPAATALPQQAHQYLSEVLRTDPTFTGVVHMADTPQESLVTVANTLMAKVMIPMVLAA